MKIKRIAATRGKGKTDSDALKGFVHRGRKAQAAAQMQIEYAKIIKLVEQEKPPKRDEVQRACDRYNEAVHRFLDIKHE